MTVDATPSELALPESTAPGIRFSEEAALLAQSASDFLGAHSDFSAVRRALESDAGYDASTYRALAQLGWLGLTIPEAHGGAGLPVSTLVGVMEAMGRTLFASPFLASTLAAQAIVRAGSNAQASAFLPKLGDGQLIATLALFEPNGSYELEHIAAEASDTPTGFQLRGRKSAVLDAHNAGLVLVAAQRKQELAVFAVPAQQLQGRMRRETLIDETRRSARIELDGLSLPSNALLDGGSATEALQDARRSAWLLLAADMAGGSEGVLQLTLDYLKTRKQFGKTIGSYQALKHPMVEIMAAIELGRSLLYGAATALDGRDPEREIALRMACAQLAATYTHAVDRAIQFHGAIGFTYECHAQLFFRRAQWDACSFGDVRHHRRHLAKLLLPTVPPAPAQRR